MLTCDACQAQMLESLYDLLEGDDREAFVTFANTAATS